MVELTKRDGIRYEELRQQAIKSPLAFRRAARDAASAFAPDMRRLVAGADTKEMPVYDLFTRWAIEVVPEVEALQNEQPRHRSLRTALAKQLNLTNSEAEAQATTLLESRIKEVTDTFIDRQCPSANTRKYMAAKVLLHRPLDEIIVLRSRFTDYTLYQRVANEQGIVVSDMHASFFTRRRLASKERRQINRYKKQQAKRLKQALAQQQELKTNNNGIIGRITALGVDTVEVIDAYRQYKKRLDSLKPTSRTPAKTLALFSSATKPIREAHASKLTVLDKLADLQDALREVDSVLVEIFDMTDTQRNELMSGLKEYRDLAREITRITNEQAL